MSLETEPMRSAILKFGRGLTVGVVLGLFCLNAIACSASPGATQTIGTTVAVPGGAANFNGVITLGAAGNWTGTISYTVPGIYTDATLVVQIEDSSGNAVSAGSTTIPAGGGGSIGISASNALVVSTCSSGPPYYVCIYAVVPPTKLLYSYKMQ